MTTEEACGESTRRVLDRMVIIAMERRFGVRSHRAVERTALYSSPCRHPHNLAHRRTSLRPRTLKSRPSQSRDDQTNGDHKGDSDEQNSTASSAAAEESGEL